MNLKSSILLSSAEIAKAVEKLGQALTSELLSIAKNANAQSTEKKLLPLFVCLGEDSVIFFSDLIRQVDHEVQFEFLHSDTWASFVQDPAKFLKKEKGESIVGVSLSPHFPFEKFNDTVKKLGAKKVICVSFVKTPHTREVVDHALFDLTDEKISTLHGYGWKYFFGKDVR